MQRQVEGQIEQPGVATGGRTSGGEASGAAPRAMPTFGLSARLLVLTVLFVMLAEVLIFVPSVANFRVNWLMERLQAAQIASLAAEAAPGGELPKMLRDELLKTAQVRGVALKRPDQRLLILSDPMPPHIDAHFDLTTASPLQKIADALYAFFAPPGRNIRVVGQPGFGGGELIEIVMPEAPLRAAMERFGINILGLSIAISLLAAALVYLALNALLVRPMRRITMSMMRFRADPEDPGLVIRPSGRNDEVGMAETELARMQGELGQMLKQKTHLAQLGLAVSKINHDLRNMLASAQLISDRLGTVPDPAVQRVTPKLIASLDRAIRLCSQTLAYGRAEESAPDRRRLKLAPVVTELAESLDLLRPEAGLVWRAEVPDGVEIDADPDQLFRILGNVVRNAQEVLTARQGPEEKAITLKAARHADRVVIDIADTGPGIPERARGTLFQPFHTSSRKGGSGLGLAIVAELAKAHGGSITLLEGGAGTQFRIVIPDRPAR